MFPAEAAGHLDLAFDALDNEARFELDLGQKAEAISLLERAGAQLTTTGNDAQKTKRKLLLGKLFSRAGAIKEGYAALSEARQRARSHAQSREEALATGYLADDDRRADATQLYKEADFLAQAAEAPELVYQWQWQIVRLTADAGDIDAEIKHDQGALSELDKLRPTLIETSTSGSGTIDLRTAYVELADMMLRRARAARRRRRGGVTSKLLARRPSAIERQSLTDYCRDECVTDRLEPGTAVLYPIVMAERLVILLSLPEGLQQRSLPISADDLTEKILAFRRLLEKRTTNEFLRKQGS